MSQASHNSDTLCDKYHASVTFNMMSHTLTKSKEGNCYDLKSLE